jgi:nicotinamidase-related amidase
MASLPVRDPVGDHLLSPQNAALLVIDYQPSQFAGVRSIDQALLLENIVSTVKTAKAFDLPIVHSTIKCRNGTRATDRSRAGPATRGQPTNRQDDYERVGRRRVPRGSARDRPAQPDLVCALDGDLHGVPRTGPLREGYDVYPVVDAIGGTSEDARRTGVERVVQAGARPITWVPLAVELQRDWAREETVDDVIQIVLTERLLKARASTRHGSASCCSRTLRGVQRARSEAALGGDRTQLHGGRDLDGPRRDDPRA